MRACVAVSSGGSASFVSSQPSISADIEGWLETKLAEPPEETATQARIAPGRLARHYAPQSGLRLNAEAAQENELLIGFGTTAEPCFANLSAMGDLAEAAANLFSVLHSADKAAQQSGQSLAVMSIPMEGLGEAINDRLARAAV